MTRVKKYKMLISACVEMHPLFFLLGMLILHLGGGEPSLRFKLHFFALQPCMLLLAQHKLQLWISSFNKLVFGSVAQLFTATCFIISDHMRYTPLPNTRWKWNTLYDKLRFFTLSAGVTADVALSVSGLETVELSAQKQESASFTTISTLMQIYRACSTHDRGGLPGLLSFSSLRSKPPEMPRSLDWSCKVIFSLLLILHTELLQRSHGNL